MAFRQIYSPQEFRFNGGTVFWHVSVCDPLGSWFVKCERHLASEVVPVQIDVIMALGPDTEIQDVIIEAAVKALKTGCADCLYEHQHKTSRFPEGAEI